MIYILDACALIAFLSGERGKGFEAVDALFIRAEEEDISIFISIINLTEVFYHIYQRPGRKCGIRAYAKCVRTSRNGYPYHYR